MTSLTGSRPPVDVSLSVSEFPDWLSPIFVRDLRQGLRARFFVWGFLILQSVTLLAALVEWAVTEILGASGMGALFVGVTSLVFGLILPISLFNALQPELGRGRNVELLLTAQLSRWQIVRGKLLVASTVSALMLISIFPYFLIRYFLGGVEPINLIHSMLSLLLSNMAMNAIMIGASAFSGYAGRMVIILLLMIVHSISIGSYSIRSAMTLGSSANALFDFAGQILLTILCTIFSLQLGRAKLKLFDNPLDPPATFLVFLLLFLSPVFHGIALVAGGPAVSLVVLAVMIAGALLLDPGSRRKKQLKA